MRLAYFSNPNIPPELPNQYNTWKKGYFRLFISHLAIQREMASELRDALALKTVSAFVAHNAINPIEEWRDVILDALANCDAMIVMLHPGFRESTWIDQEIGFALGRGILVIPIRLGADPTGFLNQYQGLNGNGKGSAQITDEIIGILTKHNRSAKRMAEMLVDRFENSSSYEMAKKNALLLLDSTYWDESLVQRCQVADTYNEQIAEARGVAQTITTVLRKWGAVN